MTAAAALFDPRTTLARPDLAEQALEGIVRARTFRAIRPMRCVVPVADIDAEAAPGPHPLDQLIHGEAFDVLDEEGDRLWGRARRDGVVGWVDRAVLMEGAPLPTHRIGATDADLPLNALVVSATDAGLAPIGSFAADPVEVAERLLGTPHAPGHRTSRSTDCAGLVQQALQACGLAAPRYPDQQAELGQAVARDQAGHGDLVIWPHPDLPPWNGHSAFLLDGGRVLHATGFHGKAVIEPLAEAEARYAADGFSAPLFRRLAR